MQSNTIERWPAWQSTKVAAAYCGVSILVIRRAVTSGALKAGRRGRLFTFRRTDLDRWMAGGMRRRYRTRAYDRHVLGLCGSPPIVIQLVPPQPQPSPVEAASPPPSASDRAAQRWGITPDGEP